MQACYNPIAWSLLLPAMYLTVRKQVVLFKYCSCKSTFTLFKISSNSWIGREVWSGSWHDIQEQGFRSQFVHYIAESQRQQFHISLASCCFYSILMNSSTEICENELFVILFSKTGDTLQEVKTCAKYFAYWSQQRLMQVGWCLSRTLKFMGIENLLERVFLVLMNFQFL